ncbi:hypothetical protein SAMN06264365_13512 [Actinoplanes regularis]|uniref:Uncharacterized protein n=1 Tax=Actinoplanes regularis TaxID=52697 RepID=A0A239JF96_9ACTN|nr:hypothetical protein Are01nite_84740 [Actinoplanes regularis]SNT04591.1 hypothetical protein SAMN06264365_13512 [Actinoplanes regularis]
MDHLAVCLPPGQLDDAVDRHCRVSDFEHAFEEQIFVGRQAMLSKVVQSRSRGVTFTIIEPDLTHDPGQIDTFIADHDGAGVANPMASCSSAVNTAVPRPRPRRPDPTSAAAFSPSGCSRRWYATGAAARNGATGRPSSVEAVSQEETSRSTRGTTKHPVQRGPVGVQRGFPAAAPGDEVPHLTRQHGVRRRRRCRTSARS